MYIQTCHQIYWRRHGQSLNNIGMYKFGDIINTISKGNHHGAGCNSELVLFITDRTCCVAISTNKQEDTREFSLSSVGEVKVRYQFVTRNKFETLTLSENII